MSSHSPLLVTRAITVARSRPLNPARLLRCNQQHGLASVRPVFGKPLPRAWFSASSPQSPDSSLLRSSDSGSTESPAANSNGNGNGNGNGVDPRTLKLGKTIQILQERMPTLLHSPLPTEILSPSISLHLFPSTHPNLPTVRGRVAYIAALWTAPVAWGRLPGTNTRLEVLSEHMYKGATPGNERLTVRWRTNYRTDKTKVHRGEVKVGTTAMSDGEFSGIFVFEFDEVGRIQSHTIENSEEDFGGDKSSSLITVTEWLLRKAKGAPKEPDGLALGMQRMDDNDHDCMRKRLRREKSST